MAPTAFVREFFRTAHETNNSSGGIKHSLERLINKMKNLLMAMISDLPRTRRQRTNSNSTKCFTTGKTNVYQTKYKILYQLRFPHLVPEVTS